MGQWETVNKAIVKGLLAERYPSKLFRLGSDYYQRVYVLPEGLGLSEGLDELGRDVNVDQIEALLESIRYRDDVLVWNEPELSSSSGGAEQSGEKQKGDHDSLLQENMELKQKLIKAVAKLKSIKEENDYLVKEIQKIREKTAEVQ